MTPSFTCDDINDDGAATVVMVGIIVIVITMMMAIVATSMVQTCTLRANHHADEAALAAANVVLGRASGSPCQVSGVIAARYGSHQTGCTPHDDSSVTVVVHRQCMATPFGRWGHTAAARAGPAHLASSSVSGS